MTLDQIKILFSKYFGPIKIIYSGIYRWFYMETDKEELTPLVAHQHRASCMSGAVVSLPAGKEIVPEHCRTLKYTHRTGNGG